MQKKQRDLNNEIPRSIRIRGAREHNLKGLDVDIPHNTFTVVTGPSGSGKSSLAFDTLYAEGQRRYVESLSAYARQFLDRMQKPDVDLIEGLSPAIAIEQRSAGGNPRSIVATSTEVYDYLRLLFAHIGIPHCPKCRQRVKGQSAEQICDHILSCPAGRKLMILAPVVRGKKGEHREILEQLRQDGFNRVRVDGEISSLDDDISLERNVSHRIDAIVDRLVSDSLDHTRLTESVERALRTGEGNVIVLFESLDNPDGWEEELISEYLACAECNISIGELLPRNFSFNSPYGACRTCHGLGAHHVIDEGLAVYPDRSLKDGAIPLWRTGPRRLIIYNNHHLRCLAQHYKFSLETKFRSLSKRIRNIVLYGSGDESILFEFRWAGRNRKIVKPFEGVLKTLTRRYHESESDSLKAKLRKIMLRQTCPDCNGARLRSESLAVTVNEISIFEFIQLNVDNAIRFMSAIDLQGEDKIIAKEILREIQNRLGFLRSVGLEYLTLDRESGTLSGGEAQRIRLANQLGSGLMGVLYVLDEPTIGLHQRDNQKLLATLKKLKDLGNTVVVIEHDLETIVDSDYIIDLGPGAGVHGGKLIFQGTPTELRRCAESLTGQYLYGDKRIEFSSKRKKGNRRKLKVVGAGENNLNDVDVVIPLGTFCCVTGVSGSGKSTLVNTILVKKIRRHLKLATEKPGKHKRIEGLEFVDKVIVVDQSPIGRTPRSNPATYTGLFDTIRLLFSRLPASKVRGYTAGRFSFNVKGGRCEGCKGDGIRKIEMQFLPDVYVPCELCNGDRYNRETLTIKYKGYSIADVLGMTVNEALECFKAVPRLFKILETLSEVGLGYICLGQSAITFSGGEAQRIKLAKELARPSKGHTLYVLDEPTTGLHIDDVGKLLGVLRCLRDNENTVLVIEHNLDVIKACDYIIDLGPEGGDHGGNLVTCGTPEDVASSDAGHTGRYLREILDGAATPAFKQAEEGGVRSSS